MATINEVTQRDFEQKVLNADRPVLVDFYADWCAPCQSQKSILKNVANNFAGKIDVVKVDVDRFPELARTYYVPDLPTLMLFKNGKGFATHIDFDQQSELETTLINAA